MDKVTERLYSRAAMGNCGALTTLSAHRALADALIGQHGG